jgi:hypothetical protein
MRIPRLLPYVVLYNVEGAGRDATRLVGEAILEAAPHYVAGRPVDAIMSERAAAIMIEVFNAVVKDRAPRFRAGKAHWTTDKDHRDFEACFLPMSRDGTEVNIILGGVKLLQ